VIRLCFEITSAPLYPLQRAFRATFRELLAFLPRCPIVGGPATLDIQSPLDACTWRNGMCGVETTLGRISQRECHGTGRTLFFLSDALARGMSIRDLAGFLNRTEDEVRQQARWRRHDSISSCEGSPSERHRRSTETKSAFSDESTVFLAKRRASAARLRH
jgi:hypothetical protein